MRPLPSPAQFLAEENASFTVSEQTLIKYGVIDANGEVVQSQVVEPGTYVCSNAVFGPDPAVGTIKACYGVPTASAGGVTPSAFFAADQEWTFRVRTWDTPQSVLENDQSSQGMRLRVYQPKEETTNWTEYATALKAAGANPESAFTNSTFASAAVADGRWPLVQAYWGSGTPNWWGGARSGRVALCFSGTLVSAARRAWLTTSPHQLTFALAGSGWARIDIVEGGVRRTVFNDNLSETVFLSQGFSYSTTSTLAEGAEVHIYYVQTTNDPWGGLVVKAIPGARPSAATIENVAAAAPVVSCGLFSYNAPVSPVTLPFISRVEIRQEPGAASRAEIEVPLINSSVNDGHGWLFYQADPTSDPGALRVYDGGALVHTLRRKRLIRVEVARKASSALATQWMPVFTGHVDDFTTSTDGRLVINAVSFEGRLVEQYEQLPDRISYMSRGFRVTDYRDVTPEQRKEPVYNVPAFDNWPLAWAFEEVALRSGLDPSGFRKPYEVVKADGTGISATLPWGRAERVRGTSLSGELVRLPRPVHYGNVGLSFTETRPYDDEYLFKIEPTKDNWARTRELTDRLGYVCRFDTSGAAVLYPSGTPSFVRDLVVADKTSGGSVTAHINPAAFGAKYLKVAANAAATLTARVYASRIDISFPRVADARSWTVTVTPVGGGTPTTTTVDPSSTESTMQLFFDATVSAPGSNSTVYTAFSGNYGQYDVVLTAAAGAHPAYVDCILAYAQDPDKPLLPTFSTADAARSVSLRGQQDAVRNKVTIVGRRKGAVTDSDKFAEAQAPTEQEFVVQNAVDVASITDRAALNYVGYLKQAVIYDESIGDDGLARYLAQVFIYRQSVPRAGTEVMHTLMPMLEPGDPVAVQESKFDTIGPSLTQYVTKVRHTFGLNRFETTIETDAWPNYPAYQPRLDINLADFDNKPIADLTVDYTSLSGHAVANPSINLVKIVGGNVTNGFAVSNLVQQNDIALASGSSTLNVSSLLPWPPVPGTVQVRAAYTAQSVGNIYTFGATVTVSSSLQSGRVVQRFTKNGDWYILGVTAQAIGNSSIAATEFSLKTLADGGLNEFFYVDIKDDEVVIYRGNRAFTAFGATLSSVQFKLAGAYRILDGDFTVGWLANSPYHRFVSVDYNNTPAGPRIQIPWQQLVTSTRPSTLTAMSVRYLSLFPVPPPGQAFVRQDPNGAKINGVSYSPFYDPYTSELGNLVSISCSVLAEGLYRVSIRNWDDGTVVAWLTNPAADPVEPEQHWEYIQVQANKAFTWDGVDQLGEWNGIQSGLYAELVQQAFSDEERPRVGRGFYCWNREIDGSRLGPQAYVWMEQNADGTPIIGHGTYAQWYIHIEAETTTTADPEVTSKDTGLAILTHLPEPTKLELKIEDAAEGTGVFSAPAATTSPTQLNAYIHNEKPIRIRFRVANRPGALWAGKASEVSVKLSREVHLRAVIGDQSVVYRAKEFPGTSVEDRTIYNRRLVNDEHTRQYTDTGYRKAATFRWLDTDSEAASTEWVFYPSDFKKDFIIAGLNESIEFGNYLQLEEVPEWSGARALSAARSRLHFALMSYLFYLSAYVTDRSGRSSWGINRSFVDKSKIYSNTQTLDWPLDPMYEQRRTIVCRQWTNEPNWEASQRELFGYDNTTLFARLLQSFWHQYDITSTTVGTINPVQWSSYSLPSDPYSTAHTSGNYGEFEGSQYKLPTEYATRNRQLGDVVDNAAYCSLGARTNESVQTGTWNWEADPLWIPSITRDLHPFFLLPPMVSPPRPVIPTSYATLPTEAFPGREDDFRKINCYWTVGGPANQVVFRRSPASSGVEGTQSVSVPDAGGAETWTSPIGDYSSPSSITKRFWPGFSVDVTKAPFKNSVTSTVLNYVRQDETVHYEDLRGMYSRGKYPIGQLIKVSPVAPYYINPHRYNGFEVAEPMQKSTAFLTQLFPPSSTENRGLFVNWFRIAFRSEYVWESGSMFPSRRNGEELLEAVLWWRHRFLSSGASLYYDYGAWTGWKDDFLDTSKNIVGGRREVEAYIAPGSVSTTVVAGNPFLTNFQPVGVGPVLPQTTELVTHLVLVPERRGSV